MQNNQEQDYMDIEIRAKFFESCQMSNIENFYHWLNFRKKVINIEDINNGFRIALKSSKKIIYDQFLTRPKMRQVLDLSANSYEFFYRSALLDDPDVITKVFALYCEKQLSKNSIAPCADSDLMHLILTKAQQEHPALLDLFKPKDLSALGINTLLTLDYDEQLARSLKSTVRTKLDVMAQKLLIEVSAGFSGKQSLATEKIHKI